jgi:Methyltransferase FkbM domain
MTIKDILLQIAREHGVFMGRTTDISRVRELIALLRPKAFNGSLVRIGAKGDGGYLVPDDLIDIAASISPGVSSECGFDLEIANRGIPVFLLDASVNKPPVDHDLFKFFPYFVGPQTRSNYITLDDFCGQQLVGKYDGDFLLQMDIEGAELDVLATISDELLSRFRIIVIEFHDLDAIFDRFAFNQFHLAFSRLSKHHEVVHLHANNARDSVRAGSIEIPRLLEVTYYRRDRSGFFEAPTKFPHSLDFPNVPGRKAVDVPKDWAKTPS